MSEIDALSQQATQQLKSQVAQVNQQMQRVDLAERHEQMAELQREVKLAVASARTLQIKLDIWRRKERTKYRQLVVMAVAAALFLAAVYKITAMTVSGAVYLMRRVK